MALPVADFTVSEIFNYLCILTNILCILYLTSHLPCQRRHINADNEIKVKEYALVSETLRSRV
jgi:hypothetical protein